MQRKKEEGERAKPGGKDERVTIKNENGKVEEQQQEDDDDDEEEIEEGIRAARNHRSTRLPQYLTALVLSLTGFSLGTVMGWSAPGMEKVRLAHQPGSIVSSWVTAIMPLGGFTSTILTALTLNRYGRKKAMLGLIPVYIAGWIIIGFGNHLAAYLTGRYLTGMSGGSYAMIVPIYMGEIAQREIRGRLSLICQTSVPMGLLYIYSTGFSLSLDIISIICTVPNVLFFVLMLFIPESPRFLISHGKEEEANKALQWFRGPHYHYVEPEMRRMKRYSIYVPYRRRTIVTVFKRRSAKSALLTSAVLMITQQLSGINVVITYSVYIFSNYIKVNDQLGSIIIASMMILGTFVAMLTIERLGRRKLLIFSQSGLGVFHFLLAIFYWVITVNKHWEVTKNKYTHWLAVAFSSIYVFIYTLGAGPLPWMMLGELFPYQMKPVAVGLCASINWIFSFFVALSFKFLEANIGIAGVHFLYGCFCIGNTVTIYCLVMETTGLSLEQIQSIFQRSASTREARQQSILL